MFFFVRRGFWICVRAEEVVRGAWSPGLCGGVFLGTVEPAGPVDFVTFAYGLFLILYFTSIRLAALCRANVYYSLCKNHLWNKVIIIIALFARTQRARARAHTRTHAKGRECHEFYTPHVSLSPHISLSLSLSLFNVHSLLILYDFEKPTVLIRFRLLKLSRRIAKLGIDKIAQVKICDISRNVLLKIYKSL